MSGTFEFGVEKNITIIFATGSPFFDASLVDTDMLESLFIHVTGYWC